MSGVAQVETVVPAPAPVSFGMRVRRVVRPTGSTTGMRVGAAIVLVFLLVAVVSVFWTPYPPEAPAVGDFSAGPVLAHPFGTDQAGSDVFSKALAATRVDVGITIAVVLLALVVGAVWGAIAGYVGGWFDALTQRILQTLNAFPALLLAMLAISALGRGLLVVIFVVALIPLPDYVRLARAEIVTRKTWEFAEAARMVGRGHSGVLFRHLLPNSTRPLIAYAAINASWVVSTVGALGFLGLGFQPGSAEWGSMIAGGQTAIAIGQWWICFFPGLGIFLLALAFHLIGDGLTDADLTRHA